MRSACGNPAALAFLASNAGFGDYHELESFYARLPADYDGKLPAVTIATACCRRKSTTDATSQGQASESPRVRLDRVRICLRPPLLCF